jgi:hypothetical protein
MFNRPFTIQYLHNYRLVPPRSGKKINSVFYFFHGIANIEHGNSNHTLHEVVHDHYYLDQAHHNN